MKTARLPLIGHSGTHATWGHENRRLYSTCSSYRETYVHVRIYFHLLQKGYEARSENPILCCFYITRLGSKEQLNSIHLNSWHYSVEFYSISCNALSILPFSEKSLDLQLARTKSADQFLPLDCIVYLTILLSLKNKI